MSTYGTYSLRLRPQRIEQLRRRREQQRKERARQEAGKLLAESRQISGQSASRLDDHFSQDRRQQTKNLAGQAEQLLASDPDKALELARNCRAAAEHGMAEASRKTARWSRQKNSAEQAVTVLQLTLESAINSFASDSDDSSSPLIPAAQQLAAAKAALRRENFEAAKKLATTGRGQIDRIEKARQEKQQQAEIRQQISRGLARVLTNMGFSVSGDAADRDGQRNKTVLVGRLPSGRQARFVISSDGRVDYDFDGYRHRECGKDSEKIRHLLEKQCQADTTHHERFWKDGGPNLIGGAGRCLSIEHRRSAEKGI